MRIADAGQVKQPLKDAQQLLDWIYAKGHKQINPSLVYQFGPNRRQRTKGEALKVINILEDHGWLTPLGGSALAESKHREVWRVESV